eukprot:scaffold14.g1253.t1
MRAVARWPQQLPAQRSAAGTPRPAVALARRRCHPPAAVGGAQDPQQQPPEDEGSPDTQDKLVSMLRLEIGKKQVEEMVEEKSEELRQVAEGAKEELDKLRELTEQRASLAFDRRGGGRGEAALADLNKEADDFEEQLRRSREELEASRGKRSRGEKGARARETELVQWENDVAVSRSQGQFFQSLYQADKKRPVGESSDMLRRPQAQQQADKVKEPARTEIRQVSRARFYLFALLAFLLAAQGVTDLASDAPSALQDTLYILLAVALGFTAVRERAEVMR